MDRGTGTVSTDASANARGEVKTRGGGKGKVQRTGSLKSQSGKGGHWRTIAHEGSMQARTGKSYYVYLRSWTTIKQKKEKMAKGEVCQNPQQAGKTKQKAEGVILPERKI